MIVTAVRAYRVRVRPTDPIRTGRGPVPERADLLVELVTDDGRSGWGNGSDSETGIAALAGAAPHVLGVDLHLTDPRSLWPALSEALPIGPLSAVDTALWDLRGQALGQSVASLLGAESGHVYPQVRAYATGLFRRRALDHRRARPRASTRSRGLRGRRLHRHEAENGVRPGCRHAPYRRDPARHRPGDSPLRGQQRRLHAAAIHCPRRGNRRLRRRLDGRTHRATRLGRLPSGPHRAPGHSPRPSPSLAASSSAQRATSPPAATPQRGTLSSPTWFRPAASPACGAWAS